METQLLFREQIPVHNEILDESIMHTKMGYDKKMGYAYSKMNKSSSRAKFWGRNDCKPQGVRRTNSVPSNIWRDTDNGCQTTPQVKVSCVKRTNTAPAGKTQQLQEKNSTKPEANVELEERPLILKGFQYEQSKKEPTNLGRGLQLEDRPLILKGSRSSTSSTKQVAHSLESVPQKNHKQQYPISKDQEQSSSARFQVDCQALNRPNGTNYYTNKINNLCKCKWHVPFMNMKSVPGDGNCLRYAVLWQLSHEYYQDGLSERALKAQIKCHKDLNAAVCDILESEELQGTEALEIMKLSSIASLDERSDVPEESKTWEWYLQDMRKNPKSFADETYVFATALFLGKDILIADERNTADAPWRLYRGALPGTSFKSVGGPPLTLAFLERHYEPLSRLKTEESGCRGCGAVVDDITAHLELDSSRRKKCDVFYNGDAPIDSVSNCQSQEDEINVQIVEESQSSVLDEQCEQPVPATSESPNKTTKSIPDQTASVVVESEKIHKWECNQCHTQLSSSSHLWRHKKDLDCLAKWCGNQEHEHDFLVQKFDTRAEAETFMNDLPGQWIKKSGLTDKNMRKACVKSRREKCGAKFSLIPQKRKNDTTDFTVKACLGHNHDINNNSETEGEVREAVEVKLFPSLQHALDHVHDNELDSMFRIRKEAPRKYGSYRRYECRRKEKYIPKKYQSKKNTGCDAFFSLKVKSDHVEMQTQLKHHGHGKDNEKSVMSQKCREELAVPLSQGVTRFEMMKRFIMKDAKDRTKGRLPNLKDIYAIEKKVNPGPVDTSKKEHVNVYEELNHEAWRGFNVKKHYGEAPQELKAKEVAVEDDMLLFCYMTEEQRRLFRKFPKHVMLDTSHKTNRHGMLYGSVMVLDARGAGLPVMHYLIESEGNDSVKPVLKILKKLEPTACQRIITLASDLNEVFINNARKVLNPRITWIPCAWHIDRRWKARMQNLPAMLQEVRNLRKETDIPEFWAKYESLGAMYRVSKKVAERNAWAYFQKNYGRDGLESKPEEWARAYNYGAIPHNLFIERMHGDFKFRNKSNLRVDEMLYAVREYASTKSYALAVVAQRVDIGVSCTQAQKHFNADHDAGVGYQIQINPSFNSSTNTYKVTSPEGNTHTLRTNDLKQCNEGLCEVICKDCPAPSFCGHHLKCDCEAYSHANRCKHIHMVNIFRAMRNQQVRNELPMVPAGPQKASRQRPQNQQIPVTHNKRKHSPQKLRIPVASRKRPKQPVTLSDEDKGEYLLYKNLTAISINGDQWGRTVCRSKEKFADAIKIMPQKQQTMLLSLYDAAKGLWECAKCEDHTIEKFNTRYIECRGCGNWYHRGCVSVDVLPDVWQCLECTW